MLKKRDEMKQVMICQKMSIKILRKLFFPNCESLCFFSEISHGDMNSNENDWDQFFKKMLSVSRIDCKMMTLEPLYGMSVDS